MGNEEAGAALRGALPPHPEGCSRPRRPWLFKRKKSLQNESESFHFYKTKTKLQVRWKKSGRYSRRWSVDFLAAGGAEVEEGD